MAKYGSNSLIIAVDNSSGSVVTMTQYVTSINSVEVEALIEEAHSFGDSFFESLASGVRKCSDLVLGGFYDDTSTTGPDAIFNAVASSTSATTRTVTITWGGSKTTSFEGLITKYSRSASRNELTKYEVTITPSGTVTEA